MLGRMLRGLWCWWTDRCTVHGTRYQYRLRMVAPGWAESHGNCPDCEREQ